MQHRIISAVKRAEFVSDRMSYIVLKGCWFKIIVLNMHAPSVGKSDDSKDSFIFDGLEQYYFYRFSKYHMKILLGDFNAKVERDNIFKPTIENESLHQDRNDKGVRIVKYVTSKILWSRVRCSRTETFISTPRPLLMGRLTTRLITY